jgi:hypothetical protein
MTFSGHFSQKGFVAVNQDYTHVPCMFAAIRFDNK